MKSVLKTIQWAWYSWMSTTCMLRNSDEFDRKYRIFEITYLPKLNRFELKAMFEKLMDSRDPVEYFLYIYRTENVSIPLENSNSIHKLDKYKKIFEKSDFGFSAIGLITSFVRRKNAAGKQLQMKNFEDRLEKGE